MHLKQGYILSLPCLTCFRYDTIPGGRFNASPEKLHESVRNSSYLLKYLLNKPSKAFP